MSVSRVKAAVETLMPHWHTSHISDVKFLEGGYANENYFLTYGAEGYVMRIPAMTQPFVHRTFERDWYAQLPNAICPAPLAFDAETGAMLSAWIDGELLVDVWQQYDEQILAEFLADMHDRLPACDRPYALQDRIWEYTAQKVSLKHDFTADQTCHNDLNPWNIIVTPHGWVTLDWEFVGRNDPLFDLAGLHQGLELPSATLGELAEYYFQRRNQNIEKSDLDRRVAQALAHFWRREQSWAQYQISIGNQREEIVAQFAYASEKIKEHPF